MKSASTNTQNNFKLRRAIICRKWDKAEALIIHGADVNISIYKGLTPLHFIVQEKDLYYLVNLILKQGADVTVKDEYGKTPLYHAMLRGNWQAAKLLLEKGADINTRCEDITPLFLIIKYDNSLEFIEFMIDSGADINAKNVHGRTAFSIAIINQKWDIAKLLLKNGADVNSIDNYNCASLHIIRIFINDLEFVEFLLDKGAEINVKDLLGNTPLHYATEKVIKQDLGGRSLLFDRGADLTLKNSEGIHSMDITPSTVKISVVNQFLDQGADINLPEKDNLGNTPLHFTTGNLVNLNQVL